MLERAALHQTRFRTPGVSPDARGVLLGQKGSVLFPSLDRVVAFLRAYSEDGSLDELLPGLSLRRVITPLKTRELLLSVSAQSSYRMDRIASLAKLTGGLVFTGTSRHFVKYRDAASPLGYDVVELSDEQAGVVLYHDTFEQAYAYDHEIAFADLVMKLQPLREPPGEAAASFRGQSRLFVSAEVGVGMALVAYLFRWQVKARAAFAEWPSESAFDDQGMRLYLFEVFDAPPRIVELMVTLPGVHVFAPVGPSFGVELGFRHPIALDSCASIFDDKKLTLFRGASASESSAQVYVVDPAPAFAPVRSLVRNELRLDDGQNQRRGRASGANLAFDLPLRLDTTLEPVKAVVATVIPDAQRPWLARMLYALPPRTLANLQMAIGPGEIYLIDRGGIEGLPLGRFYSEIAERIYVPAGMTLVPRIASQVLQDLVSCPDGGHVFFEPQSTNPKVVAAKSFGPISREVLREIGKEVVSADAPERHESPLPMLQYGKARRFPLWGAVGKDDPSSESDESSDEEA